MEILKCKRGITAISALVGILIAILSFIVIMTFLSKNSEFITSEAQDYLCRGAIEAESNRLMGLSEEVMKRIGIDSFITDIIYRNCQIDRIKIDSQKEEDVYREIGDSMARCWFRYGEGEKDFLSPFGTVGNWCFICSSVSFEGENGVSYDYKNFVDWLSKTKYKEEEDGKKIINYSNYMSFQYTDVSDEEMLKLESEVKEILDDKDPAYSGLANVVLGQYENFLDLKLKQISPQEDLYVVFRYNRMDKSFEEKMSDAGDGVTYAILVSIFAGSVIEGVATGGLGFIKTPLNFISGLAKLGTSTAKVLRIEKVSRKIASFIKKSNKVSDLKDLSYITYKGKKYVGISDVSKVNIDKAGMLKIAEDLDKLGDTQKANNLRIIGEWMDEMKIKDIKDIDKLEIKNQEDLNKLHKLFDNGVDVNVVSDDILEAYAKKEMKVTSEMGDLKALRDLIKGELNSLPNAQTLPTIKDYIRTLFYGSVGMAGAVIAMDYNQNDNFNQYIDIMSKEQYFRLCGTEKKINERLEKN